MPNTNARCFQILRCCLPAMHAVLLATITSTAAAQDTAKPVLHGSHWVAVTGKPMAATTGAMMFARGGNAIDAACAMLGATSTMWDTLGWGGETQAHRHIRAGAYRGRPSS